MPVPLGGLVLIASVLAFAAPGRALAGAMTCPPVTVKATTVTYRWSAIHVTGAGCTAARSVLRGFFSGVGRPAGAVPRDGYRVFGWLCRTGPQVLRGGTPARCTRRDATINARWTTPSARASAIARVSVRCGSVHLQMITGTIEASGIRCQAARAVFRAVELTRLPSDVAAIPYFHYSRLYAVKTPEGTFGCRREPHGLAGSEHNIRCRRSAARVSWYTVHD